MNTQICYNTTQYVKGRRIYRVRDLIPGNKYIFASEVAVWVATVNNLERLGHGWGIDYRILDAEKYGRNTFSMRLWDYMLEPCVMHEPTFEVYEALTPEYTCKQCGAHDVPMPIPAVQIIKGQRIGRSCNYYRCEHCNTINKHIWITGY